MYRVQNEEVLQIVEQERNIIHQNEGRLIGYVIACIETAFWNTLLKGIWTENKRDGKKRKKMSAAAGWFKETQSYWNLKEEALDRTVGRTWTGRGCGPVERETVN